MCWCMWWPPLKTRRRRRKLFQPRYHPFLAGRKKNTWAPSTLMKSTCHYYMIFHQRVWRTPEHWVPHHLPRHGACTGHANLLCQTGLSNSSIILPSAFGLRWPILWSFPKFLGLAIRKPTWSDGSVLVLSILILLQYLRVSWFLYLLITECPLFIFSSKPRMVKMKTWVWQQFAFSTLESIPSRSAHIFLAIVYLKVGIVV